MPRFDYKIIRSNRKTTAIEITKDCQILVRAPLFQSQKTIEKFLEEKTGWIEKALRKQALRDDKFGVSETEKETLRQKAKEILPQKIEHFSALTGLCPTAVKITSAKTRFGSCSGKNSICFSLYLMQYPEAAIDYVVLHELCHTKIKNHSSKFWAMVENCNPYYKSHEKWLKKNRGIMDLI